MLEQVIIIPVHNQYTYLNKCLQSLERTTERARIIIVDDGSDEETQQFIINNADYYGYDIIRHEEAKGFSAACNAGITYAMNKYNFTCLCLLNSDTEVITKDWFSRVEECFEEDNDIYIAGVMSNNALSQTVLNEVRYLKDIDSKMTLYAGMIHGFCYFISKSCIRTFGLLDTDTFPHYGSEDDYSMKVLMGGKSSVIVGSVYVKHYAERSYTPSVRNNLVKKSLPALLKKYGRGNVMNFRNITSMVCTRLNK